MVRNVRADGERDGDARASNDRHCACCWSDDLRVRENKGESEAGDDHCSCDEAAEVDWSRALVVGREVIASAVREQCVR